MTYLNNSASDFPQQALRGFAAAHQDYVVEVHGGVVRSGATPEGQPALVVGGGTGHYPAFAGWVGPGMAHGSPCGNIFSSPSASQVYSVAKNAENGGGVILGYGHYAGDVLHFGAAAEKLRAEGIDVRTVRVSDDIASGTEDDHRDRRGIAGDLPVFKILGAAIEAGADLSEAERIGWKANDATRSLGVAFDGCTLPGADEALFHVDANMMGVGLGIHGEPGIKDLPVGSADEVADLLYDGVMAEAPAKNAGRVAVILNGLGTVKYEELFVVYGRIAERFAQDQVEIVAPEVGEFVTSLDMAGLSLTVVFLDEELETHWSAPVNTPAYRRGAVKKLQSPGSYPARESFYTPGEAPVPESTPESREFSASLLALLEQFRTEIDAQQQEWGRLDAVAGDGDHGQAMALGIDGAVAAARKAAQHDAGARTLLIRAGTAWAESAGGTSGALWGAVFTAAGAELHDDQAPAHQDQVKAIAAGAEAIIRLGGAQQGDKTMADAAIPFAQKLRESLDADLDLAQTLKDAAQQAHEAAQGTADLTARRGRSRVLGEKSRGTPDPGAVSFAALTDVLATWVSPQNPHSHENRQSDQNHQS